MSKTLRSSMELFRFLTLILIISSTLAEYHVTFYLKEEKAELTLVGDVATSSLIANNMTTEEFTSLKYSFLDQNKYQSLFTINSDNGKLFTSVVIDRETECRFQEECSLQFEVAAHSSLGSRFLIISVEVIIQDLNDNVPTFQSGTTSRQISEAAIIGSPIILNEATDFDSTLVNRILSYDLVPSNAPFTFSAMTMSDGGFDLKLILNKTLDRENIDSYNIYIVAKDGGNPQNTGTLTAHIEVTDFNDNAPVFVGESYNASIPENAIIGYSIIRVVATDKDIGANGEVSYKLNPRQSNFDKIQELFSVSETTGKISVKGSLQYESGKLFQIGIEASDKGQQPRTSHITVKVTVLDVVNNSPQVKVNFLLPHNSGEVNISEASKLGTVIAHVTAEDVDSGLNGDVSCSISRGIFSLQAVPDKGYIIVVNGTVDRETKLVHNISVTCTDRGSPVLSSSENFLVKVIDFNDNPPEFYQSGYQGSILENGGIGDFITQVRAWDRDQGQNANISYAIDSRFSEKFAINPNTGVVTSRIVFDREANSSYTFVVLAIDQGSPPLTGTTSVTLIVLDQNDNRPSFDVPLFQFFVLENLPIDSLVGTLSATDPDEGDNAKILYEMHSNYRNTVPFQVFPDGAIKTTQSLDREYQSKFEFHINAVDQGSIKQTSSIAVKIYVADDNDNRPIVTHPGKGNETAAISYLAQIGTVVTQIRAYDLDEHGPNSQLKFSIIGGNAHDVFSIGENSGKIYLKRTFEIKSDTVFRLKINISDMNVVKTLYKVEYMNIILKFSNGTAGSPLKDAGSKNVLIVVGFVAFTAILSIVIITVICILRRNDMKKEKLKTSPPDLQKTMYSLPPEMSKTGFNVMQVGTDSSVDTMKEIPKKKKEVSFSLDDDVDVNRTHDLTSFSQSLESKSQRGNSQYIYPIEFQTENNHQTKHLALHRMLLDNVQLTQTVALPGDNLSDSSGEITTSDSGRGGSDLDLSHQSHRNAGDKRKHFRQYEVDGRKYKQFENDIIRNSSQPMGYGNSSPNGVSTDIYNEQKPGEDWVPSYV